MKTIWKRTIAACLLSLFAYFLSSISAFAQTGPVNLDFEQGTVGQTPTGWYFFTGAGSGYTSGLTKEKPVSGTMCVVIRRTSAAASGDFSSVAQTFEASLFRGKQVRFRAAVRASVSGSDSAALLWLRVDRPNGQMGFFDNMSNRPITSSQWGYYEINGPVAADATRIFLGLILHGSGSAWIDDCSFEITAEPDQIVEAARPLTPRGLENVVAFTRLLGYIRHFHPSDETAATDWDRFAIEGMRTVENAGNAAELASSLQAIFSPVAPALSVFTTGNTPSAVRPIPPPNPSGTVRVALWNHVGFGTGSSQSTYHSERKYTDAPEGRFPDELAAYQEPYQAELGGGVSCSFPIALFADSNGTWPRGTMPGPTRYHYSARDRATRLAAVALAWNVFQHFYPYFDAVPTDWPAALKAALNSAATDTDEVQFLDTLRRLVAALHDGHGRVYNANIANPAYGPPFAWDWIEGQLVITQTFEESGLAPGDVVLSINGKPAATAIAEVESLISGATPQWILYRAIQDLYLGNQGDTMTLEIEPWASPGKQTRVTVTRNKSISSIREPRPAKIDQLEPGIFYVDLGAVSDTDIAAALPQLAQAQGIIFDMRGYPGNIKSPATLFSHIAEQPVTSAWWNVPVVTFPDQKGMQFQVSQWNYVNPQEPILKGRKAIITDGRAISYAESCMGIFEHYKLAEIVGGPTAGTNGNVNPFTVPGDYTIYWTGMKVLKHDGSRHHGVGIRPTVPAVRTRAGVAAGVDELLQRAIQIVSPASGLQIEVPGGGAAEASTIGAGTPVQAGYAVAQVNSGSAPYGVAIYSFKNSNATVDVDTGIALVNPGSTTANVSFTLRDRTGATLAVGHGTISGAAHYAKFISQLGDLAADFKFPDNFSTGTQFGSLDVVSDQPLSITALRITVNQRGETILTSTPIADLTRPPDGLPLYFPQFAEGGGYRTALVLLNTSAVAESGKLAFFGDEGTPLVVKGADGTSGSTLSYSIQPGGTFLFQTAGSAKDVAVGWIQVSPDAGTPSPAGAAVFSLNQGGILVTESGVPRAALTTHARIYIDQSTSRGTGLAIANSADTDISIVLTAFATDGSTRMGTPGAPMVLKKNGHAARFVSQLITGLPVNFSGVLDISSPSPFAALTLQSLTNPRGDFLLTTFPVADPTRPAPAPLVFPQIADGGGYLTRFVLLAADAPVSANLTFAGDDGTPLPVGSSKGVVKF